MSLHYLLPLLLISTTMNSYAYTTFMGGLSKARCSHYRSYQRHDTPRMSLHIQIHIRGKRTGGEEFLNDAYEEYTKRLRPVLQLETVWHKTDSQMEAAVGREKAPVICLDEGGKQFSSKTLASRLYEKFREGGSRVAFVIGGAEGLPTSLKTSSNYEHWSLSKLTFTHQWARVILTEQIYRATEIYKGSGYHKE